MKKHESVGWKAVAMLRDLIIFMIRYPRLVEMEQYVTFGKSQVLLKDKKRPTCGSVGCIAGLSIAKSLPNGLGLKEFERIEYSKVGSDKYNIGPWGIKAAKLMGLTERQAYLLFIPNQWPNEFHQKLYSFSELEIDEGSNFKGIPPTVVKLRLIKEQREYVNVIVERIEHFIETGE